MINKNSIMFSFILVFLFILMPVNSSDKVKINLDSFSSIPEIMVSGDCLYAWSGVPFSRFFIYSISEKRLIKNILKKGEGPGEIKSPGESIERVNIIKDKLYIYTNQKLMVFTLSGEFLHEKRFPFSIREGIKCGEKFIGLRYTTNKKGELFSSLNIYDPNFRLVKTIYKQRKFNPMKYIEFMLSKLFFTCYKNNIYIADNNKGLKIIKYDLEGNKTGEIIINYNKKQITNKDKKHLIKQYINKGEKYIPVFHKYYPSFRKIIFYNDKIYVQLYKSSKPGKIEFIVYDMINRENTRIFLPFCMDYAFYNNRYYCVKIGKGYEFYMISENFFLRKK